MYDLAKIPEPSRPRLSTDRLRHIALIGSFPPRRCGIATFTADLLAAIASADASVACDIVAMTDPTGRYEYEPLVRATIRQDELADYGEVARRLNDDGVQLACIQHEFGIFGGEAGEHVLNLISALSCPVVTTMHTVLANPNPDQARVQSELIRRSDRIVVMSEKGRKILTEIHGAPPRKVDVIPHGAPDRPCIDTAPFKARLGLSGRKVLLTFGLLSPNKGLEHAIQALPRIARSEPDALYVILGATHPHLVKREGEAYRERLADLAEQLGVAENVRFVNAYVSSEELYQYLGAADVYLTPYLNEAQITSGTLSYAVALGKPVVSTPYWHAAELLADGVGVLTPFASPDAIGEAVAELFADEEARTALRTRAYEKGRETIWPRVGKAYLNTFETVRAQSRARPRRQAQAPTPSLRALQRMSDACGMLQHSRLTVPDRAHGYCVDDNARALIFAHRARVAGVRASDLADLTAAYAAFVEHAWNDGNHRFRNFMGYNRQWLEDTGSEDSFGRAFWSVGETAGSAADPDLRRWAQALADRVTPHLDEISALRASAFCMLGLTQLHAAAPARNYREMIARFADRLMTSLARSRRPSWVWFEPFLCYDNARLPEALIRAGMALDAPEMTHAGLETLSWLSALQTTRVGYFRPVGTRSFGKHFETPDAFDQQPIEAAAMIDAAWAAFDASGDAAWIEDAQRAYAWFFGENDLGVRMATPDCSASYDGFGADGVNRNQGAESILSFLFATCAMRVREKARRPATAA